MIAQVDCSPIVGPVWLVGGCSVVVVVVTVVVVVRVSVIWAVAAETDAPVAWAIAVTIGAGVGRVAWPVAGVMMVVIAATIVLGQRADHQDGRGEHANCEHS